MRSRPSTASEVINRIVADMTVRFNAVVAFLIVFAGLVVAVIAYTEGGGRSGFDAFAIALVFTAAAVVTCGMLAILIDIRSTLRRACDLLEESAKASPPTAKGRGFLGQG